MKVSAKVAATVLVVALVGSAIAYEIYTSTGPSSPACPTSNTPLGASAAAPGVPSRAASTRGPLPPRTTSLGGSGPGPETGGAGQIRAWSAASPIPVVAAENFWGSLVAQLGGNLTSVTSIVSDPNADPHEYEVNTSDAVLFSNAAYVVVNGVGYDDWATRLISADGNSHQIVRNVGALNGVVVGAGVVAGNPHLWYDPIYVNRTVAAMYSDLVGIDPAGTGYFQHQYALLNASLGTLYAQADSIKHLFAGTVVAATEDIFVYLANYTGLDLISPPEFMQAVAEGNDPTTQSVVAFQCQLESGQVKVLVYNQQTVTPLTVSLKSIAAQYNVTTVGVTETIQPPGVSFQTWMLAEYLALENALNAQALGR